MFQDVMHNSPYNKCQSLADCKTPKLSTRKLLTMTSAQTLLVCWLRTWWLQLALPSPPPPICRNKVNTDSFAGMEEICKDMLVHYRSNAFIFIWMQKNQVQTVPTSPKAVRCHVLWHRKVSVQKTFVPEFLPLGRDCWMACPCFSPLSSSPALPQRDPQSSLCIEHLAKSISALWKAIPATLRCYATYSVQLSNISQHSYVCFVGKTDSKLTQKWHRSSEGRPLAWAAHAL